VKNRRCSGYFRTRGPGYVRQLPGSTRVSKEAHGHRIDAMTRVGHANDISPLRGSPPRVVQSTACFATQARWSRYDVVATCRYNPTSRNSSGFFCSRIAVNSNRSRVARRMEASGKNACYLVLASRGHRSGAESGTRTRTALRQPVFETGASANSAISARASSTQS
jgi:hypothetical protein